MLEATVVVGLVMVFAYVVQWLSYDQRARDKTVERVHQGVEWWKSLKR